MNLTNYNEILVMGRIKLFLKHLLLNFMRLWQHLPSDYFPKLLIKILYVSTINLKRHTVKNSPYFIKE